MVLKRSQYKKRSQAMKRRRRFARVSRSPRLPMITMKRTFYAFNFTPSTAATSNFWQYQSCTLSQMTNSADITSLFDQYKIAALKYTFRPRYDNFSGNDTVDTTLPGVTNQGGCMIHIINDPYSQLVPTGVYSGATLNTFLEQGNVRTYNGNRPFSVYFKPTIDNTVGAAVTNAARSRAKWLSTINGTGIAHYGFHFFAQDVNLTGVFGQSWDVYITYYIQAKGTR